MWLCCIGREMRDDIDDYTHTHHPYVCDREQIYGEYERRIERE